MVVAVIHHRDDAVMSECSIRSTTPSSTHTDDDDEDFNKPWGSDNLRLTRSRLCNVVDNNKVTPRYRLFAKQRELTNDANVIKTLSNSGSSG